MFESLGKVCEIVRSLEKVNGRKRFQKTVHILKTVGFEFNEPFRWGNFGPYSSALAQEVDMLVDSGILDEQATKTGDCVSYVYNLTNAGEKFLEGLRAKGDNPLFSRPQEFVKAVDAISQIDVADLELLSTCLFVWEKDEDVNSMLSLVKHLKEQFSETRIRTFMRFADQIMRAGVEARVSLLCRAEKELTDG